METAVTLQINLIKPTPGVVFGLQKGSGNKYETEQKQIPADNDLSFRFNITIKGERSKDAEPKFAGPYVQGPVGGKFIYIDIGTYAGQAATEWARRLKIPLQGISWNDIDALHVGSFLQTNVPGTGKDGGPNCATVKPFEGWHMAQR